MENLSKNRYHLDDEFYAKGCNDYGLFKIVEVVHENYDDTTYTLESLRYGQKYTVSDTAIDQLYKKIPHRNKSNNKPNWEQAFKSFLGDLPKK